MRSMPVPRTFGVALAVLALGVVTACGGATAPSGDPSATPGAPAAAPAPEPPTGPVPPAAFSPCDGPGFECATVDAPVDHTRADGPRIGIAIVRLPARDQARKVGTLLINPGGPGGSGVEFAEGKTWPDALRDRFDIVGFDPRGVGRSQALDCGIKSSSLQDGDPDASDPADVTATEQAVDRYTAACGQRNAALLPNIGTTDVARDMDRIRAALGQEKISYLGFSYGTSIGQTFARMYPDKLRTWVVDGVVDQSATGPQSGADQAKSFEVALRSFADGCKADPACPIRPDPIAVVDRIGARLSQAPLPVPGNPGPLYRGEFESAVGFPLYSKDYWPILQRALAMGDAGDGRLLARLAQAYDQEANLQVLDAVNCLDSRQPANDQEAVDATKAMQASAPHFNRGVFTSNLTCASWPVKPKPLDVTPPTAAPHPIVVGTTNDPATPYENSVRLARLLPGSVLVTYRGDGHTAYLGEHGPCVDDPISRYLVDGTLPPGDVTC